MPTEDARCIAGRYRLLSPLGAGAMGTVWRARDEVLGREVAVKEVTFPPGLPDSEREVLRERTRREARAAARLDHPAAVTVYDVVEEEGAPYLVMELIDARTLSEVVRAEGRLTPQRTAQIGLALLGALEAAHARGIVHRDVKPSNVLVRDDGRVVLTDFGISTVSGDHSLTHTGTLLGSPAYIAPERARGQSGPPSDLWSLGATLFTAVEGRPPFDQGDPLLTVTAVVTGEHAPYAAAGALGPVLEGLLTKDPAQRLDAAAARTLLERVARSAPVVDTPPAAPVEDPDEPTAAIALEDVRDEIAAASAPAPPPPPPSVSPPAAPSPRRVRRAGLVAAALVAGVGAGAAALSGADNEAPAAIDRVTPEASTTPAPRASRSAEARPTQEEPTATPPPKTPPPASPTASSAGEAGDADVPSGWQTDTGSGGWTVALPAGYERTGDGEYREPGTGRTLRIETGEGQPDAVEDRENQARSFAERHPTYDEIDIRPAEYRGYEAADWEFTYEDLRVINRVFVVDGTGHSLYFQASAEDFPAARAEFDAIAKAFEPASE